jgi:hypothetical protein
VGVTGVIMDAALALILLGVLMIALDIHLPPHD